MHKSVQKGKNILDSSTQKSQDVSGESDGDEPYHPFYHLCKARNWAPETLVAMLTGYFDEAGGKDHGFTFVAGWLATVAKWQQFEYDWKLFLAKYGRSYFHMVEFAQGAKAFKDWKGPEHEGTRRAFLQDGLRILNETIEQGFAVYVNHEVFENTNCYYEFQERFSSPYALAGRLCVELASLWADQAGLGSTDVRSVFEDGGPDRGGLLNAMTSVLPSFSAPSFEPKRDVKPCPQWPQGRKGVVQLQPADWLAYEVRKFTADHEAKTGDNRIRASLGILPAQKVLREFLNFQRTEEFCRDKAVPKRLNPVVNPAGVFDPTDVLCPQCHERVFTANREAVRQIVLVNFTHSCGFKGPWVWNGPISADSTIPPKPVQT